MAPLKCCVTGCNATSATHRLFSLPKDDNLRNLWMSFLATSNSELIGLTKEQLVRKRVCHQHFDRYQMDRQGGRTRYSYPCLFSDKEIAHGIPLSSMEYTILAEHNYHQEPHDDGEERILEIENKEYNVLAEHCYHQQGHDDAEERILVIENKEHSYSACSSTQVPVEPITPVPNLEFQVLPKPYEMPSYSVDQKETAPTPTPKNKELLRTYEMPSCSFNKTFEASQPLTPKKKVSSKTMKKGYQKQKYNQEVKRIAQDNFGKSGSQRLNEALNLLQNPEFFAKFKSLSKQAQTFLIMQLKLVGKNKKARRFNMEEKLITLTIMKQSPKCYKLLENMFALPTKRTLSRLSEKICFEPGINIKVFKYIQELAKNWDDKKKLCTIVFDEVALSPHLTYNESKDVINGFVELGGEREFKYCDHALVFMIRGICSPWRQCLAYYFCEGTVSAIELVHILKNIVHQVSRTGLQPLGLVCDQGSTFRTAINLLRQQTVRSQNIAEIRDYGTVNIAGINLNIFYDPPHLLKSIRNNLVTKDMLFEGKMGSWKDIIFVYDIDSKLGHTRALPKLMAHHVIPSKIKKMKVSVATQTLSARTAAMLKYTHALNIQGNTTMDTTAEIVEFFDSLFDSVNGSPGRARRGKLRSAVKTNSQHIEFWQEAIKKLKKIQFKDTNSKLSLKSGKPRFVRVPCLEGWITTLESFIRIAKLLMSEHGVEYFYPRYINQDPLENFFGRVRALNYRNVNPDANSFIYSYKALVLSNLLSPRSQFCNCEEDNGETLISLNYLFEDEAKENVDPTILSVPSSSSQSSENDLLSKVIFEKIKVQCSAYTAGYLCRNITKIIKCTQCVKTYTTSNINPIHSYIQHREYKRLKRNNLVYPNEQFLRLYRESSQFIHECLNNCGYCKNIGTTIKKQLVQNLRFSWLGCKIHNNIVQKKFLQLVVRLQVHNWCKIINKILKGGVEEKYVNKMQEPQKMAYKKYVKTRLRKKILLK